MQYIATTQETANWLLVNPKYLTAIADELQALTSLSHLQIGVLPVESLRIAATRDGKLTLIWHVDYLSSSGQESWGFCRLGPQLGLLSHPDILQETLERWLYVVNQRLQGRLLGQRVIHKTLDGNVQACLAGRGQSARQMSLAYVETPVSTTNTRNLLAIGPSRDRDLLSSTIMASEGQLPTLTESSNDLITAALRRPPLDLSVTLSFVSRLGELQQEKPEDKETISDSPLLETSFDNDAVYSTLHLTYDDWIRPGSPLNQEQRRILESDVLLKQPLRISGAAGSGKTLLMQLLTLRRLHAAKEAGLAKSILYITHNAAMAATVRDRFLTLGAQEFLADGAKQSLCVQTLFQLGIEQLELDSAAVIAPDAGASKLFQLDSVNQCVRNRFDKSWGKLDDCPTLRLAQDNDEYRRIISILIAHEIGVVLKGMGLIDSKKQYVESEVNLSRFHGVLTALEREMVFQVCGDYQREYLDEFDVLDSDDIAVTMLGRLRTPLWGMQRRKKGFDFVFVDETQLFNENERRVFSFLTRGDNRYAPIILALDEAQELRGGASSGFGRLGIEAIANEELQTVHRCTKSILRLAFNLIQKTTDLFGVNFPDFTQSTDSVIEDSHKLAETPELVTAKHGIGDSVLREVRALRRANVRQIGVIVHAERYFDDVSSRLLDAGLPLRMLQVRGERISPSDPVVVLAPPDLIGGQEFDAVITVGLEQGVVPPRFEGHPGLATALEQQALREMYLSFTRARYRLSIIISTKAAPTSLLGDAVKDKLITLRK